eukprot:Gb_18327 [translate_table: standard]
MEQGIPVSLNCSLRGVLSTPVEVREWSIWGLPTDDVSVDNGILVTRGERWPLMIDPQGQANSWIKAMEAKNGLRVVRLTDPNLLRTLESSIRIGNPVLLEDIGDTLDPALEPVLQKQYSLAFFCQLFNHCIDVCEPAEDLETRLEVLISFITEFICLNVSRGLFEEHKLTFSFLVCTSIMRYADEINQNEWNFFLRGAVGTVASKGRLQNPSPQWISETMWHNICSLEDISKETFDGLSKDITENLREWKLFFEAAEPHNSALPTKWDKAVDLFQRLLLIKCLREEKIVYACEVFVKEKLGKQFVGSVPLQLEEVFKDTSNTTPIIFILSTGADPTGMLQRFGEKVDRKPGERLHIISLGQGQGPIAEMLVSKSRKTGDWVCLQNCHLASSWMQTMERLIEKFIPESGDIHPEFRLWLTSIPCKEFPVPVLQVNEG